MHNVAAPHMVMGTARTTSRNHGMVSGGSVQKHGIVAYQIVTECLGKP